MSDHEIETTCFCISPLNPYRYMESFFVCQVRRWHQHSPSAKGIIVGMHLYSSEMLSPSLCSVKTIQLSLTPTRRWHWQPFPEILFSGSQLLGGLFRQLHLGRRRGATFQIVKGKVHRYCVTQSKSPPHLLPPYYLARIAKNKDVPFIFHLRLP